MVMHICKNISPISSQTKKHFSIMFFLSPSTLRSVRRHSAIVFENHKRWHVGDISSDISPI
jgi:hypothetical protein